MRYKPNHTCIRGLGCLGCAYELGESEAKRKPGKSARYVWMVTGSDNPCDIRRYEFTYQGAVGQVLHAKSKRYKDYLGGTWRLFKLVPVKRDGKKSK